MKAIQTKFHGHTQHKSARISASVENGDAGTLRRYYSIPCEIHSRDAHAWAALQLARERGWLPNKGEKPRDNDRERFKTYLVGGGLPDGSQCWVFSDSHQWDNTTALQGIK